MVCYAIPIIAAIAHGIMRKKTNWKDSVHHLWLSLLLTGGAIFGLVDHLWNGELFLIGENILMDLMLGIVITIVILVIWGLLLVLEKTTIKQPVKV
jgi:hypothetical protein